MFTKEQLREYRRSTYVSDTSVRDAKTNEVLGKLLTTLAYTAKQDAGKYFEVKMLNDNKLDALLHDGWSDALVVNQENLAATIDSTKMTVSRYMSKAIDRGYLVDLGKLRLDGARFDSGVYMVNILNIANDFSGVWFDLYQELGNKYYHNLEVREKSKVTLNNKCMTQLIWQDLKKMIDEANEDIPDKFKIKFMNLNVNGDYIDSRYYSVLCNSLNPERHPESDRIDLLRERFNTDKDFVEIDVNSMMLRTSYNLIHNESLSKEADVYYELYKKMTENPMPYDIFKKEARQLIKKNVMPIYMDPRSVYCKINSNASAKLNQVKNDYEEDEIMDVFRMPKEEFLTKLKESMYQFLSVYDFDGDLRVFFGAMFFKYEAIVYYYMNRFFKEANIASANVYDGFYFIEGTCDEEKFYEVYNLAIEATKKFLADHDHDLIKIYGKTFTLKYRIYKNAAPKKTERYRGTYDIPTAKVEHVEETVKESAEEHADKQNNYVQSVYDRCKELEAQGKKAFF